ncbi:hypothetical protein FACS1894164_12060 [Spirochaetia bacterium]|nr:hypothetical protein FACS1894164_12060 [Spirochaetia bacterium]
MKFADLPELVKILDFYEDFVFVYFSLPEGGDPQNPTLKAWVHADVPVSELTRIFNFCVENVEALDVPQTFHFTEDGTVEDRIYSPLRGIKKIFSRCNDNDEVKNGTGAG